MLINPHRGKYVMLEGPEGGGKTTQTKLLAEAMTKAGLPTITVKEPSVDNPFGRLAYAIYSYETKRDELHVTVKTCLATQEFDRTKTSVGTAGQARLVEFEKIAREVVSNEVGNLPFLLQLSMILARRELLISKVIPALKAGTNVVSDRGFFSTLAYGSSENLDWRSLWKLHEELIGSEFVLPNLVFLFDVPVDTGLRRTYEKQAGKKDHFDHPEVMQKISGAYRSFAGEPEFKTLTIHSIDGTPKAEEIHGVVWGSARKEVGV